MSRHRKYRLPTPPHMEGEPSPAEIIEASGKKEQPQGNPVQLIPAGPSVEFIEGSPRYPKPDPNRPLVPTESEAASLTRWTKMAFASRCARRLLPLLDRNPGTLTADQSQAITRIVKATEQSAATGTLQARTISNAARIVKAFQPHLVGDVSDVATITLAAAQGLVHEAARTAVNVLLRLANVRTLQFALLPRRDFDLVLRLSKEQNWTDETAVSPDVFGPMWDREPPSWWREDELPGTTNPI